jgi:mono/diheme cytochrome c family protein
MSWSPVLRGAMLLWLGSLLCGGVLRAQAPASPSSSRSLPELRLDTGEQIFEAACVGCHGPNGRGQPLSTLGFEPPATYPDFTDCNGSTRERKYDWRTVIHEGGPGRGFSEIMPAYAEALTLDQIELVMSYMREQCTDPAWPLGELNFPRALFTEKAFPEDEWVLQTAINTTGDASVASRLVYERRFGPRNQLEIVAPAVFSSTAGDWVGGVGDLVAGLKRVMYTDPAAGSIVSVQGEMALPTGNEAQGLGLGTPKLEAFGTYGQTLRASAFLQTQAGLELPFDTAKAPRAVFGRAAIGRTFAQGGGFGRSWSPIVELLADREFEDGARVNWDIVPQVQVTLNRRQHVRVSVGVRRPLNDASERTTQFVFYGLWDFFDGGLRDGW